MILKSFKNFLVLLFVSLLTLPSVAQDEIDIWKNKKKGNNVQNEKINDSNVSNQINFNSPKKNKIETTIQIEENISNKLDKTEIFGVYDPADFNFDLNMWTSTNADDVRASLKRLKKIELSKTSNEILEQILLSFSYPPSGMKNEEFVSLKINWLIENNRSELIEDFLKQNKDFSGKSRAVQYLVDENIAQANIKKGCEKIKFIDTQIKDSYLEKFKIYCLVYNKKNSQAQLLLDLLREQKQSDKFFDDKINFLLGISEKTSNKINEKKDLKNTGFKKTYQKYTSGNNNSTKPRDIAGNIDAEIKKFNQSRT